MKRFFWFLSLCIGFFNISIQAMEPDNFDDTQTFDPNTAHFVTTDNMAIGLMILSQQNQKMKKKSDQSGTELRQTTFGKKDKIQADEEKNDQSKKPLCTIL